MDDQLDDNKKVFRVFDASQRKRTRKKPILDDSLATDDSNSGFPGSPLKSSSAKASLQSLIPAADGHGDDGDLGKRSPSISRSQAQLHHHHSRSPKRHGKSLRDGISLALKAGMTSPRSESPNCNDALPRDEDQSYVYAYLVDALKREKKKHRHSRHSDERHRSRERDVTPKEHRHRHKRDSNEKCEKENEPSKTVDPSVLFETFAKLCSQFTQKTNSTELPRTQSHKSLQYEDNVHPVKISSKTHSKDDLTPKIRSMEHISQHMCACDPYDKNNEYRNMEKYSFVYPEDKNQYSDSNRYKSESPRYRDYVDTTRSRTITKKDREHEQHYYKDIEQRNSKSYDYDRQRQYYDKRQYNIPETHEYKRSSRRLNDQCERRYDDLYSNRCAEKVHSEKSKYFDKIGHNYRNYDMLHKEHMSRRNLDSRFERTSIASRDDDYKERLSARERDSGLSIADNASLNSVRSNNFRSMKQEISQQREAMDKMMVLWKELMRCVKGMSQNEKSEDKNNNVQETAKNARDSAEEQLRLWQECMRRYETVARDVGDTDARLMEEINKQRSEMMEMSTMWQECLQRYRDISKDFNNLKQQLAINETPTRIPPAPLVNPMDGESMQATASYRLPPTYGHTPQPPPPPPQTPPHYQNMIPPMRPRASAPPNWWWYGQEQIPRIMSPGRRRSSPDSRGSRERRKHRERDRDDTRYKEKSKPTAARSEHRHKKRC